MRGVFVGLTTLDLIHYVEDFPLPDEKIQARGRWMGAGGPAANAAVAFAALGGSAELVTAIGSSPVAEMARRDLEENGVGVIDFATGGELAVSSIAVDRQGRRTAVSMNAAGFDASHDDVPLPGDVDVVLVDGHHPAAAISILDQAGSRACATILDGGSRKPQTDDILARVRYAIASAAFAGGQSPEQVARELLRPPVRLAAVSRGAEALVGATEDSSFEIPVEAVDAVDTLGAGDVLHGAFAYHLCLEDNPVEALAKAAAIATESCTVRGPRIPD